MSNCSRCGKSIKVFPVPLAGLLSNICDNCFRLGSTDRKKRTSEGETKEKAEELRADFPCPVCNARLRVRLENGIARCPSCSAKFAISQVMENPIAFLLVSETTRVKSEQARQPTSSRPMPERVKKAFTDLGLMQDASLEDVRKAYRDLVRLYHPDKVAHLGAELKRVAETKTKEINAAYEHVEKFLSTSKST